MQQNNDLLACPFCGTKCAKLVHLFKARWGVTCQTCDTMTDYDSKTPDEAIEFWNDRPSRTPAAAPDEVGEVRLDSDIQGVIDDLNYYMEWDGRGDDYYSDVRKSVEALIEQMKKYHRAMKASVDKITELRTAQRPASCGTACDEIQKSLLRRISYLEKQQPPATMTQGELVEYCVDKIAEGQNDVTRFTVKGFVVATIQALIATGQLSCKE